MSAAFEQLTVEQRDAASVITLNRPESLNAFTAQMGRELADAINLASDDDAVRVIILTGAGRHFCAGADISDGADSFDTRSGSGAKNFGESQSKDGAGFIGALFNCKKPTITAFNGSAVGVGLTMTLPADIRICSNKAKFGFVFSRRGLPPEAGSSWFLPQLVGLPQALKWCLTGRVFEAEEALSGGLVSEITEPDQLMVRALELASEIADNTAPVSVALTRQLLWRFGPATHPFDLLSWTVILPKSSALRTTSKKALQPFSKSVFLSFRVRCPRTCQPAFPGGIENCLTCREMLEAPPGLEPGYTDLQSAA